MKERRFPTYDRPCPVCNEQGAIAYVLVGMPVMDDHLRRAMDAGRVTIGGCLPPIDDWKSGDEAWSCSRCESEWVTRKDGSLVVARERGRQIGDY